MTDWLGMRVDQPQLIPPLRMEIMEILRAGGPYINFKPPIYWVDEFIPYMNTEVLTQKTLRDEGWKLFSGNDLPISWLIWFTYKSDKEGWARYHPQLMIKVADGDHFRHRVEEIFK